MSLKTFVAIPYIIHTYITLDIPYIFLQYSTLQKSTLHLMKFGQLELLSFAIRNIPISPGLFVPLPQTSKQTQYSTVHTTGPLYTHWAAVDRRTVRELLCWWWIWAIHGFVTLILVLWVTSPARLLMGIYFNYLYTNQFLKLFVFALWLYKQTFPEFFEFFKSCSKYFTDWFT